MSFLSHNSHLLSFHGSHKKIIEQAGAPAPRRSAMARRGAVKEAPPPPPPPPGLEDISNKVLKELIQTEAVFAKDLWCLCICYLHPLRKLGAPLFSKESERAIFSNVETLRAINDELMRMLLESQNTFAGVAAAFAHVAPVFIAYSQYCSDFVNAHTQLDELRKRAGGADSAVDAVLQAGQARAEQSLPSLLIKPVQWRLVFDLLESYEDIREAWGK